MATRATLMLPALLAAAILAGCAAPEESADPVCAPQAGQVGERGNEEQTVGSGTGDITTADGGDPSRPANDGTLADECLVREPAGTGDGTSTGLGEYGGGWSTQPQAGV